MGATKQGDSPHPGDCRTRPNLPHHPQPPCPSPTTRHLLEVSGTSLHKGPKCPALLHCCHVSWSRPEPLSLDAPPVSQQAWWLPRHLLRLILQQNRLLKHFHTMSLPSSRISPPRPNQDQSASPGPRAHLPSAPAGLRAPSSLCPLDSCQAPARLPCHHLPGPSPRLDPSSPDAHSSFPPSQPRLGAPSSCPHRPACFHHGFPVLLQHQRPVHFSLPRRHKLPEGRDGPWSIYVDSGLAKPIRPRSHGAEFITPAAKFTSKRKLKVGWPEDNHNTPDTQSWRHSVQVQESLPRVPHSDVTSPWPPGPPSYWKVSPGAGGPKLRRHMATEEVPPSRPQPGGKNMKQVPQAERGLVTIHHTSAARLSGRSWRSQRRT